MTSENMRQNVSTMIFAVLVSIILHTSSHRLPPPNPEKCKGEEFVANITNFYLCAESGCLVNTHNEVWRCQTFDEISNIYMEEIPTANNVDLNCKNDQDCMLINIKYKWRCCYEGYCQQDEKFDAKKDFISSNTVWFLKRQTELCDSFYRKYICDPKTTYLNEQCYNSAKPAEQHQRQQELITNEHNIVAFCQKKKPEDINGICLIKTYGDVWIIRFRKAAIVIGFILLCIITVCVVLCANTNMGSIFKGGHEISKNMNTQDIESDSYEEEEEELYVVDRSGEALIKGAGKKHE
jgi:hypothetical protein